jgi:predicted nuclease of predicted toxin-antitoxin system
LSELRFYLDENIHKAVAEQLRRWGIDAVSVHDLGFLSDTDEDHLRRATEMSRVVCTHDTDFIRLAEQNIDHAGIIFAPHYQASIGGGAWFTCLAC